MYLAHRLALLTLLCLCLPLVCAAQAQAQEPRDYFLPGELPAEAGSVRVLEPVGKGTPEAQAGAPSHFPIKSTIEYTSFGGTTYTLHAYSGKYIRWAVQDSWLGADGLSEDDMRELVDLTDQLYAQMAEVAGGEPSGTGLLTLAAVDVGPYGGLGYVGLKGVEVAPFTIADTKKYLALGQLNGYVQHEMSHNFDIYTSYMSYYSDFSHAWTTFFPFYLQVYSRTGDYDIAPDAALVKHITTWLKAWDQAGNGVSWETCVRNGSGCEALGVRANDAWGGIMLRYARLHGPTAVRRVFDHFKAYKAANVPPLSPDDKNDLFVEALAYGANANVACEMDAWHWSMSSAARTRLGQKYSAQNPMCADADADGYSRAGGDYNDNSKAVHPGAVETRNGVDDDCNDIVDDVLTAEPAAGDFPNPQSLGFPAAVSGRITGTTDGDAFTISLTAPRKVVFKLCSATDFQGWLFVYKSDGSWLGYQYVSKGQCTTSSYDLNAAGTWRFEVAMNSASLPGSYTLQFSDNKQWPAPWGTTVAPALQDGGYRLTSTTQTLANALKAPTHVRFWVDGLGFVGTAPYAATAAFNWTPPAGTAPGTYRYRAQLLSASIPVEAMTAAQPFEVGAASLGVASFSLTPTAVTGGGTATGKVTLTGAVPAGGTVVTLSSANAAASVPANVTVPAGATEQTFTITTTPVAAVQAASITATVSASSKSASLSVRPPALYSLKLSAASVAGGNAVTGTVTLNAVAPASGLVVTLSDNIAATSVPATVTVPAGEKTKTFNITTVRVAANQSGTVTTTFGGVSRTAALTVRPPVLLSVAVNPAAVYGGKNVIGTVTLDGAAPTGGTIVTLSDNLAAATTPTQITVAAGAKTKTFTITTTSVTASQRGLITAKTGAVTKTAVLTVDPLKLASLKLNTSSVVGGQSLTGTVTLNGPARAGGTVVKLSDNLAATTLPASVTVPAGAASKIFTVTTAAVSAAQTGTVTASYGGLGKTAPLTVTAP